MRKFCTVIVFSLVALLHVAPGCVTRKGAESPDDPAYIAKQPIAVRLIIPDEVFDPDNPSDNVIRCVVRNNTNKPIEVPADYASGQPLYGNMLLGPLTADIGEPDRLLLCIRAANKREKVRVAAGDEHLVFELPLQEILLNTFPSNEASAWEWKWGAPWFGQHSDLPPTSPIGERGEWRSVTFQARLPFNESETGVEYRWVESNHARLRVKGDERTKASGGR